MRDGDVAARHDRRYRADSTTNLPTGAGMSLRDQQAAQLKKDWEQNPRWNGVKAGLPAIYLSGWQVAADANDSLSMYPDQSLYATTSVPSVVRRINNALMRQDQIQTMEGKGEIDWFAPVVADAESGFGGVLNAFAVSYTHLRAHETPEHLVC